MRYSLLEMVQLILASMDSDEVNSIGDTVESLQVANMARSVFYDICVDMNFPSYETLFQLEPSGDPDKPVLMTVPTTLVRNVKWVKYDNIDTVLGETNANYCDVTLMDFSDFLERQRGLRNGTSNVGQMDVVTKGETFKFMYMTNAFPLYYTCINDNTFIFDSYRSDIDMTLKKSKTMCMGMQYEIFLLEDSFVPNIEPDQFSYFINKLKVRAFNEIKQVENKEATAETRRQKIVQQKRKRQVPRIAEVYKVARYGRNSSFQNLDVNLERNGRNET
jgi:hypothetical protein